jgi:DNA-binding winged helix-turn-helix (wHTH) protein/TolB-like protein
MNGPGNLIFYFDDFEADVRARELYRNGIKIKIYGQPFEILMALLEQSEMVVTREELRRRLWPHNTYVDFERVLNTSVMRLRNALGDSAADPRYIETLPRVGYRFIAQVRVDEAPLPRQRAESKTVEPPTKPEAGRLPDPSVAIQSLEETPIEKVGTQHIIRAGLLGAMAMAAVVFGGVSLGQWRQWRKPEIIFASSNATRKLKPAIAILGFKNLSGRPEEAWLSTAFAEMLSTEMGAGGTLRVIPTQDVAASNADGSLSGADENSHELLQKVRQASGVDAIVLGSYTALGKSSGGQVRLDVQVQDTSSGEIRARLSVTGTEEELFPMIARLGADLRRKLGIATLADGSTHLLSVNAVRKGPYFN